MEGGEGVSEKGGRVTAIREGGREEGREGERKGGRERGREGWRERMFVIFVVCMSENLSAVKGCIKPSRMCTCCRKLRISQIILKPEHMAKTTSRHHITSLQAIM